MVSAIPLWVTGGYCSVTEEFILEFVRRDGEQLSMEITRREQVRLKIPNLRSPH